MSISLDKAVVAKISRGGLKFEILVDPVKALEVKMGKDVDSEELLAAREIYLDSSKGKRASDQEINKSFGMSDITKIAYKIVREGEVQLTTEQRNEMLEDKRKKIIATIAKRAVNPQTGLPHPPERITNAMELAKVKIDLYKRAEDQIDSVVKSIRAIIPISFEMIQVGIKITPEYAGKGSSLVRNYGKVMREEWKEDGSYMCVLETQAGMQQELYDRLNSITHGSVEVKIIKKGD